MKFSKRLAKAGEAARPALEKIGVEKRYLTFDGTFEVPDRFYPPSQSDSKFQAEQALGDWAENRICDAINRKKSDVHAVHYGDNSKLFAEDEGFREAFIEGVKRTATRGKRSDLLLLPSEVKAPIDAVDLPEEDQDKLVRSSLGGLEVRSSRLTAQQYIKYQKQRLENGAKPSSMEPSVTVKIEDLMKVYLWNHLNEKPQAYVQVFFDEVYGLSFMDILAYIGSGEKLRVEKHKRSSKTTIMIPISLGTKIGDVVKPASFEVVHNVTKNGRHDIFANPSGGEIKLDVDKVRSLLE